MLHKNPKPAYRRYIRTGAAILFVAEALAFAGTYFCWYHMNTSRDYRLYMHKNFPWALEGYYSFGSLFGGESTKKRDFFLWSQEGKLDDK